MSFYFDQTVALVLRGSNAKPPELDITSNGKLARIPEDEKAEIMRRFEKWLEDCLNFPRVHTKNSPVILEENGKFLMRDFNKFSKLFGKREREILTFDEFEASYLQLSSHASIISEGRPMSCREIFAGVLKVEPIERLQLMFWLFRANYKLAACDATVNNRQRRTLNIPKMIKANRKPAQDGVSTLKAKRSLSQKGRPPRGWYHDSWDDEGERDNEEDILKILYCSGRYSLELEDVYGKWREWKKNRQIKLEELKKAHNFSDIKAVEQFSTKCLATRTVRARKQPFTTPVIKSESSSTDTVSASPVVICKRGTKQNPWANDNKIEHAIDYFTPTELVPISALCSNNICAVVEGRNTLFFKFTDTELPDLNECVQK